jgi:predicted amidohydrolase
MSWRLALAQTDSVLGDLAANVERHVAAAERAREQGAVCVCFPELSLTGYTIRDLNWELALDPAHPPSALSPLLDASRRIMIVAGGVEDAANGALYNAAFLFSGGAVRVVHRKVYPPTYGMFEEMRYFSNGDRVRAFDTPHGRLGVLICEDLWHPSLPYLLARDGATTILALVASPTRLQGTTGVSPVEVNGENHRAYARLFSVYLGFCNRVGFEDGVNFWGGSSVVGPGGATIAAAATFAEDLLVADIDPGEVKRARRFSRHFLDEDDRLVVAELERIIRERS